MALNWSCCCSCPDPATKVACVAASHYCPNGTTTPQKVADQHYSIKDVNSAGRVHQAACEAGWYCTSGERWSCDLDNIDHRPHWAEAIWPAGIYCPPMSATPIEVDPGWYSTNDTMGRRIDRRQCDAGPFV